MTRVRDIAERPEVSVLVERWSEDWGRLGWLRLYGLAALLEPAGDPLDGAEHGAVVAALRGKYPQYRVQQLEDRPLIRIVLERCRSWGNLGGE